MTDHLCETTWRGIAFWAAIAVAVEYVGLAIVLGDATWFIAP